MLGPAVDCAQRCYDEVSFKEWVRWLVDNEILWVVGLAIVLSVSLWLARRYVRKRF